MSTEDHDALAAIGEHKSAFVTRWRSYPALQLRCDAISQSGWCWRPGKSFRDGRWVCHTHARQTSVAFISGNRFDEFGAVMAVALGHGAGKVRRPEKLAGRK